MDPRVTDLLNGPLGAAVRIASVALLVVVGLWVLTGARVVSDVEGERRPRRSGPARRVVIGAALAFVLVPLAIAPLGVVETVHGWIAELVEQFR